VFKGQDLIYQAAEPFGEFELLYDSFTANNGNPITLPTNQIDITGLNISKNDELRLVYTFVTTGTSSTFTRLFPNDLTTRTNYHRQLLFSNDTTVSAGSGRDNDNFLTTDIASGRPITGFTDIKVSDNDRFVFNSITTRRGVDDDRFNINLFTVGTQTVTSITKLSITISSNGLTTGSRIRLYKVNTGDA
jgi:hypothetical protein